MRTHNPVDTHLVPHFSRADRLAYFIRRMGLKDARATGPNEVTVSEAPRATGLAAAAHVLRVEVEVVVESTWKTRIVIK